MECREHAVATCESSVQLHPQFIDANYIACIAAQAKNRSGATDPEVHTLGRHLLTSNRVQDVTATKPTLIHNANPPTHTHVLQAVN